MNDRLFVEDVQAVLLPDGWHNVAPGSLYVGTPPFVFDGEINVNPTHERPGVGYDAPRSSLLAVRGTK